MDSVIEIFGRKLCVEMVIVELMLIAEMLENLRDFDGFESGGCGLCWDEIMRKLGQKYVKNHGSVMGEKNVCVWIIK